MPAQGLAAAAHLAGLNDLQLRHLQPSTHTVTACCCGRCFEPCCCDCVPQLLRGWCLCCVISQVSVGTTDGCVIHILCHVFLAACTPVCDTQALALVLHICAHKDGPAGAVQGAHTLAHIL
jgi:hypothetical protein